MDTQTKSLLLIFNPKAGRSKPRGPLFDAVAQLSEGGYLIRIHRTTAAGDAAETAAREQAAAVAEPVVPARPAER